jgi:hypothetical protein
MVATSFELGLEAILKSDDFIAPENMDLLYLCHRFVERKLHVYHIEKKETMTHTLLFKMVMNC